MRRIAHLMLLALVALAALVAGSARALEIGDKAPEWSGLTGVDDGQHGLADYASSDVLVVIFTCNRCPVAVAYEDRLIALQKDFEAKGVKLVAINVNKNANETLDKMKERATDKGFNFPYLADPSQKTGKDYGAQKTPHVFLFDKARKLAYVGGIDDSMDPSGVKKQYLRDAIVAGLAGKEPAQARTPAVGCGIKYQ